MTFAMSPEGPSDPRTERLPSPLYDVRTARSSARLTLLHPAPEGQEEMKGRSGRLGLEETLDRRVPETVEEPAHRRQLLEEENRIDIGIVHHRRRVPKISRASSSAATPRPAEDWRQVDRAP